MDRWMIGRPTGPGGIHALKAQFAQIERVDEGINHTNRIVLVDPVIEASGNSVDCPRSVPATNPAIQSPDDSAAES